jgi:methylated-DNA-[protein]-cysteine S-methyltransferase
MDPKTILRNKEFDANLSFNSPIGPIALFARDNRIVFIEMCGDPIADSGKAKVLGEARKQLERYFAGKRTELDFEVSLGGTDFQRAVWGEIAKVGFGESITYAQIAQRIGNRKAVRAVGGAVGSNPAPLIIGCHRVLGADGKITGYSGGEGLPTKRWLLAHEGLVANG